MNFVNLEELIELEELSGEKFSFNDSVKKANEILEILNEDSSLLYGNFDDDTWIFEDHLVKGSKIIFNFSEIKNVARFREHWDSSSVTLVKCWIAELLSEYYPASVRKKFADLIKIFEQTDFFSESKSKDFIESLRNYTPAIKNCLEKKEVKGLRDQLEELKKDRQGLATVFDIINTSLNFLTFSELESFHIYHKPLVDLRKIIPNRKFARQLPKGKDVLKFEYCIKQYFKNGISTPSRLFFAPILLWWRITNIIPLRISEFCTIKRKCITTINERYYITLPREKKNASKRNIQIVDTIEITKEIFNLIDDYIQLTDPFGESNTLISFRTIIALETKNTSRRIKENWNHFNRLNFGTMLKRFYREIVYEEYNPSVEREVRPNDTRHFAFCSLLLQGISPIEIARLGGHSTIEAQYHYSNHTEYFIDVEVKKLIDGFRRKDGELRGTTFEGNEITYEDIEHRALQFPSKDNKTRLPMQIGFCTDKLQRCESVECMLCVHWWIHPENLLEVKPLIEEKIRKRKQKIIEMGNFLKNLNESFTTKMLLENEVHPNTFNKMSTEAASIQEHLEEIARLEIIKGEDCDGE